MPLVAPTLTGRIRMRIEHVGPFRFRFRQPAKLPAVVAEDGAKDLRSRFPVFFPNPGEPFHDGVRLFAGDSRQLVSMLVENRKISREDIRELRQLWEADDE